MTDIAPNPRSRNNQTPIGWPEAAGDAPRVAHTREANAQRVALAWVADPSDFDRACLEISRFFEIERGDVKTTLLGLWVGSGPPSADGSEPHDLLRGQLGPIEESMGISGIWGLCWLPAGTTRLDVVHALAAMLELNDPSDLPDRFVPAFLAGQNDGDLEVEITRLRRAAPGLVSSAVAQHPMTRAITDSLHTVRSDRAS